MHLLQVNYLDALRVRQRFLCLPAHFLVRLIDDIINFSIHLVLLVQPLQNIICTLSLNLFLFEVDLKSRQHAGRLLHLGRTDSFSPQKQEIQILEVQSEIVIGLAYRAFCLMLIFFDALAFREGIDDNIKSFSTFYDAPLRLAALFGIKLVAENRGVANLLRNFGFLLIMWLLKKS